MSEEKSKELFKVREILDKNIGNFCSRVGTFKYTPNFMKRFELDKQSTILNCMREIKEVLK